MQPPSVEECSVTFIGNATVLLRLGPFVLLTDPNFLHAGQRAYLGYGLWSTRTKDPACGVRDLPPLDAVVLSHLHGDHWDRVAEAGLDKSVPILTTGQAARTLRRRGFAAEGFRQWESHTMAAGDAVLTVTSMPGRHGPGVVDVLLPDVMGSLVDLTLAGRRRIRIYISGDTLYHSALNEIVQRFPGIDVAIVHLGGTKLLGLITVTMNGRQGTRLVSLLKPRSVVPVHFDDYRIFKSPLADFETELEGAESTARLVHIARGETVDLPYQPDGPV
jgi:L-ascorbate metabolism protein UlaG (beta-lactamase superfamily)